MNVCRSFGNDDQFTTENIAERPITGFDAAQKFADVLTPYERNEITLYPEVFYVGHDANKIFATADQHLNSGYDDETGRYNHRAFDHIAYRYKLIKPIGKGAFGDCFRAYDYKTKEYVALKIIKNEPRYHRQGKTELKVLETLLLNDKYDEHNVVHMRGSCTFRGHLVISFELLGDDLFSVVRNGKFSGLSADVSRGIASDIVEALALLSSVGVVHADLKPENILLRATEGQSFGAVSGASDASDANDSQPIVKVIDFGSSCFEHGRIHTYIQSRYYRSPEVTLGLGYGPAADMWSLGCILVELDSGCPLFHAKTERELVLLHAELLGALPQRLLHRAQRGREFLCELGYPRQRTDRNGRPRVAGARALGTALKSHDPQFLDFVSNCLKWDPDDRMTPSEALNHPWLQRSTKRVRTPETPPPGLGHSKLLRERVAVPGGHTVQPQPLMLTLSLSG